MPYDLSAATEESINDFQGASAGSRQRVASIAGLRLAQGQVSQRWAEDTRAPLQRSRRIMRGSKIVFSNVFASNFRIVRRPSTAASPARVGPVVFISTSVSNAAAVLKTASPMMQGMLEFQQIPVGNFLAMCDI
ncbi:hypothetical protein [Stieleria neptunia]|uniref:hypothetical protein n=1 Tax=Stieleria neptunia TaxID=2527979 RepID=UPI00119EDD6E|nr:hypothetical protein [Stieleria neptunia]